MFCFFKKPRRQVEPHTIAYYQGCATRAVDSLGDDFEAVSDQQGRTFSVTHMSSGLVVNAHADTAIDYYASIVAAVDRIKAVVEVRSYEP